MNTEQIKDMRLLYNAVYNEELREQFEEYNNAIYDEDIVEVATEYFYSYGLNADGISILIEKVGLESFVEYVYELSEDLILTEARKVSKAKKQPGSLRSRQQEKLAAQRAASKKNEEERGKPESRGSESEAKAEQPKSKPERKSIADRISNAIKSGVDRHNKATATAERLAGETGKTLGKLAKGVGHVAGQFGSGAGTVGKASKKVLFGEEVEAWVNQLVEEGYDLSDYTWEEMAEIYLDEANRAEKELGLTSRERTRARNLHQNTDTPIFYKKKNNALKDRSSSTTNTAHRNMAAKRRENASEEVDIYDVILSHLLDEGYAESVEQAEVIMVNMSEDWRESIVEEVFDEARRADREGHERGTAANPNRNEIPHSDPAQQTMLHSRLKRRADEMGRERRSSPRYKQGGRPPLSKKEKAFLQASDRTSPGRGQVRNPNVPDTGSHAEWPSERRKQKDPKQNPKHNANK
jgi:hypothetical protein